MRNPENERALIARRIEEEFPGSLGVVRAVSRSWWVLAEVAAKYRVSRDYHLAAAARYFAAEAAPPQGEYLREFRRYQLAEAVEDFQRALKVRIFYEHDKKQSLLPFESATPRRVRRRRV